MPDGDDAVSPSTNDEHPELIASESEKSHDVARLSTFTHSDRDESSVRASMSELDDFDTKVSSEDAETMPPTAAPSAKLLPESRKQRRSTFASPIVHTHAVDNLHKKEALTIFSDGGSAGPGREKLFTGHDSSASSEESAHTSWLVSNLNFTMSLIVAWIRSRPFTRWTETSWPGLFLQ